MTMVLAMLVSAPLVQAQTDTFTGFSMDFVPIGNAGNADDSGAISGPYGGVAYNYRMGVNEVSETMIDAYNAVGANSGRLITMDNRGDDRPATSVSWNEAARFVNWLNTDAGFAEAYKTTGTATTNIALWELGDAGYDASNPFRNSNAKYFLPSEDEWYKAAYYDPNTGTYNDYATGSDTAPGAVAGGTGAGTAVYAQSFSIGPADIANAGGLSPYGTMAQNGNVWEWGESALDGSNSLAGESRVFRGGNWNNDSFNLRSSSRLSLSPSNGSTNVGFRVAAVPEPSSSGLMLIGAMGLLMKRKRA